MPEPSPIWFRELWQGPARNRATDPGEIFYQATGGRKKPLMVCVIFPEGFLANQAHTRRSKKETAGEAATERKVETGLERHRRMSLWVASEILPHEDRIRGWFLRNRVSPEDVDELMQEAYCRLARLEAFETIASPPAYFFSIARNLLVRQLRRAKVVSFEVITELETYSQDCESSFEERTHQQIDCKKVMHMIASLPERCRKIVELRKIEGWSQKEIAAYLGMTEKAVEKQIWVGVRAVRQAWLTNEHGGEGGVLAESQGRARR